MAKRRGSQHHEEHADETWLIPYADLLTLLLALFIVLFASAQVDEKKVQEVKSSFVSAFKGDVGILDSSQQAPKIQQIQSPQMDKITVLISKASGQEGESDKEFIQETVQLIEVQKILEEYAKENDLVGVLETAFTDEGLMIRIRDGILFPSGEANLLPGSEKIAKEVAKILNTISQKIIVAGHTDNIPINTAMFPSNWELSTTRAVNFMRALMQVNPELKPERFSAVGYAEYKPLMPNVTEDGRSKNRRVEILISRMHR